MSLGAHYWNNRFARWPDRRGAEDGYTLLVPVPGDLPVMLEIALAVARHQLSGSRVSTLIVADRPSKTIQALHARAVPTWPGRLELVPLPLPERWALPLLNNGWRNHGVQLIAGVSAARSSHVILHDADLFMLTEDFLESHYKECRDRDLACLGVQPVTWDRFYEEHGRRMAATWELCASIDWMRAWPPAMHMSHEGYLWEERHSFDTTLHPQALTQEHRIGISADRSSEFVHFGYVTATYRLWQNRKERSVDAGFTHLLIRLMIDLYSEHPDAHRFPTLDQLAAGLGGRSAPIRFPTGEKAAADYWEWRSKFERSLTGPWVDDRKRQQASELLRRFDAAYS